MRKLIHVRDPRFLGCVIGLLLIVRERPPWFALDYFPAWEDVERWVHLLWAQAIAGVVASPRSKSAWLGALLILLLTFGFVPWLLYGHGAHLISAGTGIYYVFFLGPIASLPIVCLFIAALCGLLAVGVRADLRMAQVWIRSLVGSGIFVASWLVLLLALGHSRLDWSSAATVRCYMTPILFAFTYWSAILFRQQSV